SGSMPSLTPRASAGSSSAAMPSSTICREPTRSLPTTPPQTSTSTSAPRAAASSRARRLSSIRRSLSRSSSAGKKPPRQRLERRRPAARIAFAAWRTGTSADGWRHGAIQGTPARAHASTVSRSPARTVAVFRLSRASPGAGVRNALTPPSSRLHPGEAQHEPHALHRQLGVEQHAGLVSENEELAQVPNVPRALHARDHAEVVLEAVEVGEEHDAGLVVVGRRLEDQPRERDRRLERLAVARDVAGVERLQRRRRRRRDRVEDAEERVGVVLAV